MEQNNAKISNFQFAVLISFVADGLFLGIGIINMMVAARQDAWIVTIISLFTGLIPVLILIYIMNYKPDKDILEKNKVIFGKIIGNIINLIICGYMFFLLTLFLHGTTAEVSTMYLTKTPSIVINGTIILIAIYAVIKGIETICRTGEILFFISIAVVGLVVFSLLPQFSFDELRPILSNGFTPLIKSCIMYFSYTFTPLILLGTIPKNNIVNNKNYHKYLIGGFFVAVLLMFFVFFLIPGVITPKLASLYRFPAYYVHRKISIGGTFNNVENITSTHWFLNTILTIIMCLYFLSRYMKSTFKIKKTITLNIVTIVIGIAAIIVTNLTFKIPTSLLEFTSNNFPYVVGLVLFGIFLLMGIAIFIRKRIEKKTT